MVAPPTRTIAFLPDQQTLAQKKRGTDRVVNAPFLNKGGACAGLEAKLHTNIDCKRAEVRRSRQYLQWL